MKFLAFLFISLMTGCVSGPLDSEQLVAIAGNSAGEGAPAHPETLAKDVLSHRPDTKGFFCKRGGIITENDSGKLVYQEDLECVLVVPVTKPEPPRRSLEYKLQ
jgi:hypothetical protein